MNRWVTVIYIYFQPLLHTPNHRKSSTKKRARHKDWLIYLRRAIRLNKQTSILYHITHSCRIARQNCPSFFLLTSPNDYYKGRTEHNSQARKKNTLKFSSLPRHPILHIPHPTHKRFWSRKAMENSCKVILTLKEISIWKRLWILLSFSRIYIGKCI